MDKNAKQTIFVAFILILLIVLNYIIRITYPDRYASKATTIKDNKPLGAPPSKYLGEGKLGGPPARK